MPESRLPLLMQRMKVPLKTAKTCAITKPSISHCVWTEDIALSVLLRLHKNVITTTLFTWELKKWMLMPLRWGRKASLRCRHVLPASRIPPLSARIEPASVGKGCAACPALEPHSCSLWMHACVFILQGGFSWTQCSPFYFLPIQSARILVNTHVFSVNNIWFRARFLLKQKLNQCEFVSQMRT